MNADSAAPSIWSDLEALPARDLEILVEAAVSVLSEKADPDPGLAPSQLPQSALVSDLTQALGDPRAAEQITVDQQVSRAVALAVLHEIEKQPDLASEVEEAYKARREMMVLEAGVLLGAALLLVALKLKRIRVGKQGLEIDFFQARSDVLDAVRRIVGG